MKIQIIPFLLLLLTLNNISPLFAQANMGVAGGDFSESDIKVSYTLGQILYTSYDGSEYYLSQGIQLPTLRLEAVVDTTGALGLFSSEVEVFPNPVIESLNLKLTKRGTELNSWFVLQDLNGVKITEGYLSNNLTSIAFSDYPTGIYLLRIYEGKERVKTYKIIKSK